MQTVLAQCLHDHGPLLGPAMEHVDRRGGSGSGRQSVSPALCPKLSKAGVISGVKAVVKPLRSVGPLCNHVVAPHAHLHSTFIVCVSEHSGHVLMHLLTLLKYGWFDPQGICGPL